MTAHRPLRFTKIWRAIGWLMLAVVAIAMALPAPQVDLNVEQGDKWVHLMAFAVVAVWWTQLYRPSPTLARCAFGLLLFAAGTELMQAAIPWRSADPIDLLADAAGIALGMLVSLTPAAGALGWVERRILARTV